jgi:hypothetical protein
MRRAWKLTVFGVAAAAGAGFVKLRRLTLRVLARRAATVRRRRVEVLASSVWFLASRAFTRARV